MFQWLVANLGTILVCIVLLVIVCAIVIKMAKDKKQGKSSCGCGGSDCAAAGSCHSKT